MQQNSHTKKLVMVTETVGVNMGSENMVIEKNIEACLDFDSRRSNDRIEVPMEEICEENNKGKRS
jgi:hypothetical protein